RRRRPAELLSASSCAVPSLQFRSCHDRGDGVGDRSGVIVGGGAAYGGEDLGQCRRSRHPVVHTTASQSAAVRRLAASATACASDTGSTCPTRRSSRSWEIMTVDAPWWRHQLPT